MKKFLSIFALVAFFALAANAAPYKEITADDLVKIKAENKNLVIIDSRGGDGFDGVVIEGAKQLAASDTNEKTLAALVPQKDQPIVFYCTDENCSASAKASHKASEIGYTNLYKYKAGIKDWANRKLPTTTIAK